jgi:hypothetical protein
MLLIVITSLIIITVLFRMGLISSSLWVMIGAPIIIIFVLTLIARSQYTSVVRNQRYWNRQNFPSDQKKLRIPTCSDFSNIEENIRSTGTNISNYIQSA